MWEWSEGCYLQGVEEGRAQVAAEIVAAQSQKKYFVCRAVRAMRALRELGLSLDDISSELGLPRQ